MNSSELVTIVAEANDISKAQAQAILDSVFSNGSRGERLFWVSTLSGACVLCVLVRHLMG